MRAREGLQVGGGLLNRSKVMSASTSAVAFTDLDPSEASMTTDERMAELELGLRKSQEFQSRLSAEVYDLRRQSEASASGVADVVAKLDSHVNETTTSFEEATQMIRELSKEIEEGEVRRSEDLHETRVQDDRTDELSRRLESTEERVNDHWDAFNEQKRAFLELSARLEEGRGGVGHPQQIAPDEEGEGEDDASASAGTEFQEKLDDFERAIREVSERMEGLAQRNEALDDEIMRLGIQSEETRLAVHDSKEASAKVESALRELDVFDMSERVDRAMGMAAESSAMLDSIPGLDAVQGLASSVQKIEESVNAIERSNSFSLLLHKFYLALKERRELSIHDVFKRYDHDADDTLTGEEFLRMLGDMMPESSADVRKQMLFYLDPMAEGKIRYGKILQTSASNTSGMHAVTFHVDFYTHHDAQHLRVCGAHEALGWWRPLDAPRMHRVSHDAWAVTLDLQGLKIYEYKYVLCNGDHVEEWQPGSNLVLELPPAPLESSEREEGHAGARKGVHIHDKWFSEPASEPLHSTVHARSEMLRLLAAEAPPPPPSPPPSPPPPPNTQAGPQT